MKKGFTLIELLAVIVILAIIALIATPIILGIINNAKEESDKRSTELYVKAVELAVARKNLEDEFKPTTCNVTGGVCKCEGYADPLNVDVDNASNINGKITFNEKGVVISNTLSIEPPAPPKANGEVVYFNVKDGVKCSESDYHEDNSKTGYNGINPTGNQTSCLKFYAFNDTEESDKVNLLLDHNTTAKVAWNSSGYNTSGPNELLTRLTTDTSGWSTNILTPTNYTSPSKGYTVNYTTRARLITAQEIAEITGNSDWKEELTTSQSSEHSYGWLYDRTSDFCEEKGCLHNSDQTTYGYWTVSAYADNDSRNAWDVFFDGSVGATDVGTAVNNGVRPVIEVSKSSLK